MNKNPKMSLRAIFEALVSKWLNRIEARFEKLFLQLLAELSRGYLSLQSAEIYCGLSVKSLRRFIKQGRLKAYRPARGKILIKRKELDELIEKSTHEPRKGRGIRH